MVADTLREARLLLSSIPRGGSTLARKRVILVSPEYFRVEQALNPFMLGPDGKLQEVDPANAVYQWRKLKETYEKIGCAVSVIAGERGLPDMTFAANQSFVFLDRVSGDRSVVMGRMASPSREPEVPFFRNWFQREGYQVFELQTAERFEGAGDAIWHPNLKFLWGGHGPRTASVVYDEMASRFGFPVIRLGLQRAEYYHLDTCFSPLDETTVVVQERAFTDESMRIIREAFARVITVDHQENLKYFCGNCHSPNGRDVITHAGSPTFAAKLAELGYLVHEVDTSEFLKSGGSVYCLKMMVW